MNPFDHFIKRELRCRRYVRYVDDFLLFSDSKPQLWEWKNRLESCLAELRLTIHRGAHPRPVTEGIPFLGFVVYPHAMRIKRRNVVNFTRRFRGKMCDHVAGRLSADAVNASYRGWAAHASHGSTSGLRKHLNAKMSNEFNELQTRYDTRD